MRGEAPIDILYEGVNCHLAIERPAAAVVVVKLAGWDAGEFGDVPMQELTRDLAIHDIVELFIDARAAKGASLQVSAEWAMWLAKHRDQFSRINMLTGSPFIQLTAAFVRRFAELGDLMRIYTDPVAFDAALKQAHP